MSPEEPATAEGDFQRTPLTHLLVYMVDRRLSGEIYLKEPDGRKHVVTFKRGTPIHVRVDDGYVLFGELLVEAGLVQKEVIDRALSMSGLLGDVLILTGYVDGDALERVATDQLERRMLRLFSLSPDTRYKYYKKSASEMDELPGARIDVLALLATGLRAHPRNGTPLSRLMERLGDTPLGLHPSSAVERFQLTPEEELVIEAIQRDNPSFPELLASERASPAAVARVVYLLCLTRYLSFGYKQGPIGTDDGPSSVPVGRVLLRPAVHRVGAAAPDPAGDGERAAVMPRSLRKRRDPVPATLPCAPELPQVPAEIEQSDITEPVSDVMEVDGQSPRRASVTGIDSKRRA